MNFLHKPIDGYESRGDAPLAWKHFVGRLVYHGFIAAGLVVFSLAIGMAGYMGFEKQSLADAFLNASMLLGGMGPVGGINTTAGKIFAGLYALYAGLIFLIITGLLLVPVFHRVLHRFHWEMSDTHEAKEKKKASAGRKTTSK